MRKTMTALLAAGVLVVGACSGDDDDTDGAADDVASSDDFCGQLETLYASFGEDSGADQADGNNAIEAMEAAAPPDDLATDWGAYVEATRVVLETGAENLDPTGPEMTAYIQYAQQFDTYAIDTCGIEVPTAGG